ncbi:Thoeris anti-defense Tad2 family protein [Xenorhabdus bharatensis]|uniref:Thoeris anti-defense Tad2 family protein n=1 Tax=Xenorhabdus bharatensis TaxID=3136256 RepID=UPI0030F37045
MSDVNKLDDKQCPFDPYQYKKKVDVEIDGVPPIGSLPWALIQVYLGQVLHRNKWNTKEYIKISAKNDGSEPVHIEKHDQQNFPFPWQPTPEDLMACDWILLPEVKPVECMLFFDLEVGQGNYAGIDPLYGYLADDELQDGGNQGPFGTLTNLQNKKDIKKFSLFVFEVGARIDIRVSSSEDQQGYQKMRELFGKSLTITVNDESYYLGSSDDNDIFGKKQYEFAGEYANDDAKKLGDILKQNAGKTLSFCFNWK